MPCRNLWRLGPLGEFISGAVNIIVTSQKSKQNGSRNSFGADGITMTISMPNMTGRPGYQTMEVSGRSSASYLAHTPCVPLLSTLFNRGGNRRAFRLPGAGGDHFHRAVEPLPGHIRCRPSEQRLKNAQENWCSPSKQRTDRALPPEDRRQTPMQTWISRDLGLATDAHSQHPTRSVKPTSTKVHQKCWTNFSPQGIQMRGSESPWPRKIIFHKALPTRKHHLCMYKYVYIYMYVHWSFLFLILCVWLYLSISLVILLSLSLSLS